MELVQGDAARLEGVEGPFDAVMSTWAMGIVDDLPAALDRAVSVLKPGGRLAILDLHRTRAQGGVRRHVVDPVVHFILRCSGVDSAADLDDERLQRRWEAGKAQLGSLLVGVHEETNVGDSGFLLCGTKASE